MGQLLNEVQANTEQFGQDVSDAAGVKQVLNGVSTVSTVAQDLVAIAGEAVVLTLSKAWIGVGLIKPATTVTNDLRSKEANVFNIAKEQIPESASPVVNRWDTTQMFSIKLDEYYLPLSQSYRARAKKRINESSLVDGPDILQQTRKEAKEIECTLRISVDENASALQLMKREAEEAKIAKLSDMLTDLYESDKVFRVENDTLRNMFGLDYVIMIGYQFSPKVGSRVYTFEFTLREIKYGDNILTFDQRALR